ncbi:MAG: GNAT family N-acetyltransferase [Candidatus Electryonea clarkiae]|nr:GNAT family N-acetyltransferase [Candidatus Electryonea clarkiae]MDP8288142.1 GNAT family N-acetyltransferase [Candidatus Electryonea clarkiae]
MKSRKKKRFPHKIKCRNDLEVEIRPLRTKDIPLCHKLNLALDPTDRTLLREDILSPFYDQRVKRQIEDEFITRLTAWHNDEIVASLVMHRKRARWLQHTCEIRAICHPDFRRFGITVALMEEALPFAKEQGIEKFYISLLPAQKGAIKLVKNTGFRREATFKDHVKDEYGTYHDVRIYSMDMEAANKAMDQLFSEMTGYSG